MPQSLPRTLVHEILRSGGLNDSQIATALRFASNDNEIAVAGATRIESKEYSFEEFFLSVFNHFGVNKEKLVEDWKKRIETAQWVLNITEQLD